MRQKGKQFILGYQDNITVVYVVSPNELISLNVRTFLLDLYSAAS